MFKKHTLFKLASILLSLLFLFALSGRPGVLAGQAGTPAASLSTQPEGILSPYADNAFTHLRQVMDQYLNFDVYTEKWSVANHFVPSGWMGDYGDITFDDGDISNPHSGAHAIRITYSAAGSQGQGWAGIYWQQPENNWGTVPDAGFDLSGVSQLTFWARGELGGEVAEFKVGGIGGPYPDSLQPAVSTGPLVLSNIWQQYTIDLTGKDLSYVIGGFAWVTDQASNPNGATIYLDDIRYEGYTQKKRLLESFVADPGWVPPAPMTTHRYFYIYSDEGDPYNHYVESGWMGDYGDIGYDAGDTTTPYQGTTAIRIAYSAAASQGQGWAGIYWQHPAYNWGDRTGGFDLTGAARLTFWARGELGGEKVQFLVGGLSGPYPDSLQPAGTTGVVTLSNTWQQYSIDLTGADLSRIAGGFAWTATQDDNPGGATFYLDEIRFENGSTDPALGERFMAPPADFDSYTIDVAYTYDNALAILAFLATGQLDDAARAKLLADSLLYAQQYDEAGDGRLRNAYYARELTTNTGIPRHQYDMYGNGSHTGNLAWAMLALLRYYELYGGDEYLQGATQLGQWIFDHTYDTRGAGGYTAGVEAWEPNQTVLMYKSTEHNIDVYVAFMKLYEATGDPAWRDRAMHAKLFVQAMWDDTVGRFYTGTDTDGVTINKRVLPLDTNTWAILALGEGDRFGRGITWSRQHHIATDRTTGTTFIGFDFNTDRDGVWFEGTGQMVTALQVLDLQPEATYFLDQIRNAQSSAPHSNGLGIVAASQDGLTTGFDLPTGGPWLYFNRLHIGATSWFIFAELGYNPYWGISTADPIPYEGLYQ